jgi:hypothetical protein
MRARMLASAVVLAAASSVCTLAVGAGTARADPSNPVAQSGGATLRISTVPSVPGARVVFDGVTHLTDAAGKLTLSAFAGPHQLQILPPTSHRPGMKVRFSRWLDGLALPSRTLRLHQGLNNMAAGFAFSYRIRVRFTNGEGEPVPLSGVKRLTMANSLGQRFTFPPDHPPRVLAANRIVRDMFGLHALPIRYSVRDVLFGGAHVVYGGSQNFYVHEHRVWTIRLLLFPMRIEVRDALFGFGVGSGVRVRLEGGASRVVPLGRGHAVTLSGMPRATYELVAKGPGFGLSSPATLTKPLVARLLLFSWVDVGAVAGFAVLFIVGLPVVGGRIRRRSDGKRLPRWHVGHVDEPQAAEAKADVPVDSGEAGAEQAPPVSGEGGSAVPTEAEPVSGESGSALPTEAPPVSGEGGTVPTEAEPVPVGETAGPGEEAADKRADAADSDDATEDEGQDAPAAAAVPLRHLNGAGREQDSDDHLLDLLARSDSVPGPNGRAPQEGRAAERPGNLGGHDKPGLEDTAPIAPVRYPPLGDDDEWWTSEWSGM